MKPSLQVRLSQHLALTPQLQQSIRLLQLSTLELQQEVEQMLDQNPFLETEEEPAATDSAALDAARERTAPTEPYAEPAAEAATSERDDAGFEAGDDGGGIDSADFGERREWDNGSDDFDGVRDLPSAV